MVSSIVLLVTTALAGFVSAQANTTLTIDPNSIPAAERGAWCRGQSNTCSSLCGGPGNTQTNTCSQSDLTFECVCEDGTEPPVGDYTEGLPAKICEAWKGQCVDQNPNDLEAQTDCLATQCGNQTIEESSPSASTTAGPSPTAQESGAGNTDPAQTSASAPAESSGAAVPSLLIQTSTGALAAGLFALFGLAL